MEEYAETNKLHAVAFRGKVGHAEVLKAMTESNLMVSTSESEGMSMAILEAISAGVYVIATNVSGNDNMIMEDINGNLVDVNNPLQIVEKIKSFYTDKLLKHYTFPEDYIERMESMFSWNKITRQYEKLFFEILK
jgi:glycosyltransferase involved in cell wall biosynthesis